MPFWIVAYRPARDQTVTKRDQAVTDRAKPGALDTPNNAVYRERLRRRFLETVAAVVPVVLSDLAQCADESLLAAWGRRFRLDVEWVMDAARATLAMWQVLPPIASAPLKWAPTGEMIELPISPPVRSWPIDYNPALETWQDFLARLREALEPERKRIEAWYRHDPNSPLTEPLDKRAIDDHLRWLAWHQCGGKSYEQIGHDVATERDQLKPRKDDTEGRGIRNTAETVRNAVTNMRSLLGLPKPR